MIDRSTITKVYSGRPGCGCGCRGTYYTDGRNITRIVNLMNNRDDVRDDRGVYYTASEDTRYLWAYTAAAARMFALLEAPLICTGVKSQPLKVACCSTL